MILGIKLTEKIEWGKRELENRRENKFLHHFMFFFFQNYAAMKMVGPFGPAKTTEG